MLWRDLIHVHEIWPSRMTLRGLSSHRQPGMHYAVHHPATTVYDQAGIPRSQILSEIEHCLEQAVRQGLPPAGYLRGRLSPGTIQGSYTLAEIDVLYEHGINPIILMRNDPYLWGIKFVDEAGHVQMMGENAHLSVEFKRFLARYNPVLSPPVVPVIPSIPQSVPQPVVPSLPIHRAIRAKPVQIGLYLPTLS